jgi:hypothetical protein
MRYDEYLRLGYGIGSGAVESARKQVVHARLRQAGMRWSEAGARRLLALRLVCHARVMFRRSQVEIPLDLRARLEARLDLLALFRALDRMHPAPDQIPQRLIPQLFELDADYVEALWALDQPPETINPRAAPRCNGCSGAVGDGLLPFSENASIPRTTHPLQARTHNAEQPESDGGLQCGPGLGPQKRLSTPGGPRLAPPLRRTAHFDIIRLRSRLLG